MERRRELIIFILVIVLAFALEFLKGMGKVHVSPKDRISGSELRGIETQPFARSGDQDAFVAKTSRQANNGFSLNKLAELGQAAQKAAGEKARVAGAVTTDKKKKKKKKKKPELKSEQPTMAVKIYGNDRQQPAAAEAAPAYAGGAPAPAAPPVVDEAAAALADWMKRLLARPDRTLTLEFVREYQSGKFGPDVFYTVVDALLKSEDPEFHSMGVYCLSETPGPRSYNILTDVVLGGTFGPGATAQALQVTRAYEMLQFVWVPRNVLARPGQQPNDSELALAANTIEKSTLRYLGQASTEGHSRQVQSVFKGMAPVLERAIENYRGQASIATPLQTALDRIRQSNLVAVNNPN